jgi:hypothetical protein
VNELFFVAGMIFQARHGFARPIRSAKTPFFGETGLRRTCFLGLLLRLELALDSGLTIRSRISKEEYSRLGLADGQKVSFEIRTYLILSKIDDPLACEVSTTYETTPNISSWNI